MYETAAGIQKGTGPHRLLFAAFHVVGWVPFDSTVILGGLIGGAVAVGNFAGICLMVQKVVDEKDEDRRRMMLKASYNIRMLIQALWVIIAIAAPWFQPFAAVLPLFFPRITIYYLQITGKYQPAKPRSGVEVSVEDPDLDETPGQAGAPADDSGAKGGES